MPQMSGGGGLFGPVMPIHYPNRSGQVSERLKERHWKCRVRILRTVGSNPTLSAYEFDTVGWPVLHSGARCGGSAAWLVDSVGLGNRLAGWSTDCEREQTGCSAAWLARLTGGQEVDGSNPSSPICGPPDGLANLLSSALRTVLQTDTFARSLVRTAGFNPTVLSGGSFQLRRSSQSACEQVNLFHDCSLNSQSEEG